jgi:hypothetical protein
MTKANHVMNKHIQATGGVLLSTYEFYKGTLEFRREFHVGGSKIPWKVKEIAILDSIATILENPTHYLEVGKNQNLTITTDEGFEVYYETVEHYDGYLKLYASSVCLSEELALNA